MTDIDQGNVRRLEVAPPPGAKFWAERDPAVQWRSTAMMLVLMAPLAFIAPGNFISAAVAVVAMGWWNARGFRFEVDRAALHLKVATLAPTLHIPLAEIAEASVAPDPAAVLMPLAPKSGNLLIKKTDGVQFVIPGLQDVAEAADAIRRLKQGPQLSPPVEDEDPRAAA
ncbi:MAG: hypothetical protein JNM30_19680 [Rhodospirillales bacterium]|nr:hypothetical protein [Rhodospirillales bacterium]